MRFATALKVGVILIVALVVAVVVLVSSVDFNQYKGFITQKVKEATGRDLHIEGELALALSLSPTVVVEGVSFANAPWGSRPQMVTVRRLEAEVALLPLITGDVEVKRLVLIEPDILVETGANERGNWEFDAGKMTREPREPADAGEGGTPALHITEVRIEKARLTYRDGSSGQTTTLGIERLSAHADSFDSPIRLSLAAAFNDNPLEVVGTVGALAKLMKNESFPIEVTVKAGGAEVTLDGSVAQPREGKGVDLAISMEMDSLAGLSGLAETQLPPLGPIRLTAKVSDTQGAYVLKDLKATVGHSDLSGEAAAAVSGKRPKVSAHLTSTLIDLADFTPAGRGASDAAAGDGAPGKGAKEEKRIFPADPLPLDSLRSVEADVTVEADRMLVLGLALEEVDVFLNLKGGRLSVKPLKARLAGGVLSADMTLVTAGNTARLSTEINAKQVELGRLLEQAQVKDLMSGGRTDVRVTVHSRGNSVRSLMAGLNGRMLIVVGEGRIYNRSVDLAGADLVAETRRMINPFVEKDKYTYLRCAVVRFDIKDGIATTNKGIAAETKKINVVGSGTINLKTEKLDLGIHPEAREGVGLSAGALARLVRLGGTLAKPRPEPDPEGLLKAGASVGAAVATGGLSVLIKGLFSRATADQSPCASALGRARAKGVGAGGPEPASAQQKKEEGGLGGLLKSMFGK